MNASNLNLVPGVSTDTVVSKLDLAITALNDIDNGFPLKELSSTQGTGIASVLEELKQFKQEIEKAVKSQSTEEPGSDSRLPFTVVLLYPLNPDRLHTNDVDSYITVVSELDPYSAAFAARKKASEENNVSISPDDFSVVAVFEGDVTLELDSGDFH